MPKTTKTKTTRLLLAATLVLAFASEGTPSWEPVKNGNTGVYYSSIQTAYDDELSGDSLLVQAVDFYEDVFLDKDVTTGLLGGYDNGFSTVSGFSTIHGSLTVSGGTVTVSNIALGGSGSPPACAASDVTLWVACQPDGIQSALEYDSSCVAPTVPLTQGCAYYAILSFNAGSQTGYATIGPGESNYYAFTVPAGYTTFSMDASSLSQNAALFMVMTKSDTPPPTSMLDQYLQDALVYYNSDIGLWGTPWFESYAGTPAWARISNDFSGEGIYLKASTATPPANQTGFAASIPGTYYVVVNNASSTAVALYYVYAKQ